MLAKLDLSLGGISGLDAPLCLAIQLPVASQIAHHEQRRWRGLLRAEDWPFILLRY
jgi:hypothetical protein